MATPTLEQMLEEALEVAYDVCTEWEVGFLESIKGQAFCGQITGRLSDKQEARLHEIYRKVCDSPY
jgi:hypothetical protein